MDTIPLRSNLSEVLQVIRQRDYSQFPVYAPDRFCGLLTENGITRWLAHQVANKLSPVILDEVTVEEVLDTLPLRRLP